MLPTWRSASLITVFAAGLSAAPALTQTSDLPAVQPLPPAPSAGRAEVSVLVVVTDADGAAIPTAVVALTQLPGASAVHPIAISAGVFSFDHIASGDVTLHITAPGFSSITSKLQLRPGETLRLPVFVLAPTTSDLISVTATQQQIAEEEVRLEEKQKVLGFIPNFYVVYDWHAPPLTPRQKWQLAWADLSDADNVLLAAGIAGLEQAANALPGYGQELGGYSKRLAANYADLAINTTLTGALLPIVFHQDPRYFYKGTGSLRGRALYALSTAVIARGDNGRSQPAYALILGGFAAGAASNLFYAPSDRNGLHATLINGALATALNGITNVFQEFLLKKFTPNAPTYNTSPIP